MHAHQSQACYLLGRCRLKIYGYQIFNTCLCYDS